MSDPGLERGEVVERLVFGDEPVQDAASAFCARHLGAGVDELLFRTTSVGVVLRLRLVDGRRVVVKAHQPRERRDFLEAVHRVQAHLHREGFPCPRPLAGPEPIGRGLATAEELVDEGERRDAHDPEVRRAMARLLARHLELTRACGAPPALGKRWSLFAGDGLWPPEAHSPIFDFVATGEGAEWIDAVAERARPLATARGEPVIGHHDWSGEHFRFRGRAATPEVTVVYDWDSLGLSPRAHVLGVAAATFSADPALGAPLAPSPEEVRAFLDDYGEPLSRAERERVMAVATYVIAYIARCEHCGVGQIATDDPRSFAAALRRHGDDYLRP
jgi:hypothetical protein